MEIAVDDDLLRQIMPMRDLHSILLVEDDPIIAKTLSMSLRYEGFDLKLAATIADALKQIEAHSFRLVVLDVMLPDGSGIDLCRALRREHDQLPILMLTARSDAESAIAGIEGGADDYIRKPFSLGELVARLKRLLARSNYQGRDILTFGSLSMDLGRRTAQIGLQPLSLGKREYDMLAALVRARGDTVTRDQLLRTAEDLDEVYDRTIDSHLSHIRRKLKSLGASATIVAVYGVGYRLEAP
jgi:DNA-binding response OmpR family regulator